MGFIKPVQGDSGDLGLFLSPVQPDSAGIPVKTDSSVDLGYVLLQTYLACDLLKPVQTDSAGVGLFLIPIQTDYAGDPCYD